MILQFTAVKGGHESWRADQNGTILFDGDRYKFPDDEGKRLLEEFPGHFKKVAMKTKAINKPKENK